MTFESKVLTLILTVILAAFGGFGFGRMIVEKSFNTYETALGYLVSCLLLIITVICSAILIVKGF